MVWDGFWLFTLHLALLSVPENFHLLFESLECGVSFRASEGTLNEYVFAIDLGDKPRLLAELPVVICRLLQHVKFFELKLVFLVVPEKLVNYIYLVILEQHGQLGGV